MYESKNNEETMMKFRGMIEEYNEKNNIISEFVSLCPEQQRALDIYKTGKSILVMGSAGSGKSKLIHEIKYTTSNLKTIIITATTGIAAYNINGITLHSFMGIGSGEQTIDHLIKKVLKNSETVKRIKSTDILVIDEMSMLSAELFEKINIICKEVRRNSELFGGIQLVLTGDLLQLLPVFKNERKNQDTRLIFESPIFKGLFSKDTIIVLKTNFRQTDKILSSLLGRIRLGTITKKDEELLKTRIKQKCEIENYVHLVASNKQAQEINLQNLNNLIGDSKKYTAIISETGNKQTTKDLKDELVNQFNQKGIYEINLKLGSRVMLIKNLSIEEGLVNGSVGTVIGFKFNMPQIKFDNKIIKIIEVSDWKIELNNSSVNGKQLPLMLCWALTIHKSQSLTLEKAIMDLGNCFCDHQVYVALSRIKSLDGLYLRSFNPQKIKTNDKVKKFLSSCESY